MNASIAARAIHYAAKIGALQAHLGMIRDDCAMVRFHLERGNVDDAARWLDKIEARARDSLIESEKAA